MIVVQVLMRMVDGIDNGLVNSGWIKQNLQLSTCAGPKRKVT